jgi:two-component system, NarL family, capsular synthesis sensor histidine kinase RcsC
VFYPVMPPSADTRPRPASELLALRKHQRWLLYGGGGLLTLTILLTMAAVVWQGMRDYYERQRQVQVEGRVVLNDYLIERERGYMRSLLVNDVVWTQRQDDLLHRGAGLAETFAAAGEQWLVQAGDRGVPWLAIGRGTESLPPKHLAAHLGLLYESSAYTSNTVPELDARDSLSVYAYDSTGAFFAMTRMRNEAQLLATLAVPTREQAFARLMLEPEQLQPNALGTGSFESARRGLLVSYFGQDPFDGKPALVGVLSQRDGDEVYYRYVIFDPIEKLRARLRSVTGEPFMVVSRTGQVVLESGALRGDTASRLAMLQRAGLWRDWTIEDDLHLSGGRFFLADQLMGVDWAVVHIFTWRDLLAALWLQLAIAAAVTVGILVMLWAVLLRMDRHMFAPALADAERVYESDAFNRTIVATSPVALCLLDPVDAQPVLQNERMRDYAGRLAGDPHTLFARLLEGAKRVTDGMAEFPLSIALPDGAHWKVQVTIAFTSYRDRPAWLFALSDVTAQAELEINLRRSRHDSESARLAAESASRAKSQFVAVISHEIRTPLNGILGHLELMARAPLEGAQRARLRRVVQSAETLLDIVSGVLDFSRIESGNVEIDPVPFSLRALVEQVVLLFAPDAHRKGLQLYFCIHPALASGYVADAARIRQVLNNLLSNAVKFTPAGCVTLQVGPDDGDVSALRFEIIDSGIGMSVSQLAQAFEPFVQADAGITRRFGGSGLGLALCRQLATLLGGRVDADSNEGVGSVFRFTVPVGNAHAVFDTDAGVLNGKRVALLSAAPQWRQEIARLLLGWGAQCVVAAQPDALKPQGFGQDTILLIFGDQKTWSDQDEADLAAHAARVVRASADGPLQPGQVDNELRVSCYLNGPLLEALRGDVASLTSTGSFEPAMAQDRGTLLLVEDHSVNRELIQQQLEILGFTVDAAEGGDEALVRWRTGSYVAIVTDINMPGMSGCALVETIRAQGATLPIFAASAIALAGDKQRCFDAGITELLLKPLSLERLDQVLSRYLGPATDTARREMPSLRGGRMPANLRRLFVESGAHDLEALQDALAQGKAQQVIQHLHAIKGVLQMIGEADVAELFLSLEHHCGAGVDIAQDRWDHAMSAMRRLLASYAQGT